MVCSLKRLPQGHKLKYIVDHPLLWVLQEEQEPAAVPAHNHLVIVKKWMSAEKLSFTDLMEALLRLWQSHNR